MADAIVTRKGLLTLPDEVRRALRLRPGDRVSFVPAGPGRFEIVAAKRPSRPDRTLFGRPARSVSIEDVNAGLSARERPKTAGDP